MSVAERFETEGLRRFYTALLDAVGQAVIATDPSGRIIHWNQAAERMKGWTAEEAIGRPLIDFLPPDSLPERTAALLTAIATGVGWSEDTIVRHRNGGEVAAQVTATPIIDAQGDLIAMIGVGTDLTDRRAAEERVRHLGELVESTGDSLLGKSRTGEIVSWNRAAEDLYGYTAEEAIGQNVSLLQPDDRPEELQIILEQVAAGNTVLNLETEHVRSDGTHVDVSLTVAPTFDAGGVVDGASAMAHDLTDVHKMKTASEYNAGHDALTGLPNRELLCELLEQTLATVGHTDAPVAVLFLDLDQFKTVNDAVGHAVGDKILVEVARRLTAVTRGDDLVARFSGDTFVIVSSSAEESTAGRVAARLLDSLVDPIDVSGTPVYISASIGIAVSPPMDAELLLTHAEAAMYDAKARGRARTRFFDTEMAMARDPQERLQLSNDLRQALQENALEVWYQPIVDLATGAMLGVEALSRWNHPRRGMVPPTSFVAVAEVTGLIGALDAWVMHRACADLRVMIERGVLDADGYVGVNVSAHNVENVTLQGTVRSAVQAAGIPYARLTLELTETGAMTDLESAGNVLDELGALGVGIALDDFGTGYSSLSYLRRLPVNMVKIDRSFVQHITENPDDLAIAVSIIDLARSARLTTVAEGIESAEQLTLLRKLGCRAGQGYLWSPALPLDDLVALVNGLPKRHFRTSDGAKESSRSRSRASEATTDHGLKRLIEMHQGGASLDTIAAALNQEGFKTPSVLRWHRTSVAQVIASTLSPQHRRSKSRREDN
jgi:diguanylate cyclase (GGDEF)-like protein/PAS domain S-box-containing protein